MSQPSAATPATGSPPSARAAWWRRRGEWSTLGPAVVVFLCASPLLADTAGQATVNMPLSNWLQKLTDQLRSPLFWFGMCAQGLFFARFVYQWIVSEKRKRSTVPVGFWYLSLFGGFSMFIYACLRADLVIMLGQLLACFIYARNLMLIYARANRRKRAGLPEVPLQSDTANGDQTGQVA